MDLPEQKSENVSEYVVSSVKSWSNRQGTPGLYKTTSTNRGLVLKSYDLITFNTG